MTNSNDLWKETLGFISGVTILWSFVLLNLFGFTSHVQLPNGLEFLADDGRAGFEETLFTLLSLLIALGATILLLAVVHIGSRGLWLAAKALSAPVSAGLLARFDAICKETFGAVFFITLFSIGYLLMVPFAGISVLIQQFIHDLFSIKSWWGGFLALVLVMFVVVTLPMILVVLTTRNRVRRLYSNFPRIFSQFSWLFRPAGQVSLIAFLLATLLFRTLTYSAELTLDVQTIRISKNDALEISMTLGGLTSERDKAIVRLLDDSGRPGQTLDFFDLGDGHYLSHVYASSLSAGRYTVELYYPKVNIRHDFPFISRKIRETRRFVVVE